MHGLGNDFVVIDGLGRTRGLTPDQVRRLADRRFGVGCDQVLLLEPPRQDGADVRYRIYNADGSEVAQCGNGARCIAAYLHERRRIGRGEITAETAEGMLRLYREEDGQWRVNMGVPRFAPSDIPVLRDLQGNTLRFPIDTGEITLTALSIGNPHAVMKVPDVDAAPVESLGPLIQQSGLFPEGVNVGFMQVLDREHVRLRVYERGAGETLACGSGACAAVVAGRLASSLDERVDVDLRGGHLLVSWRGEGEPVWLTGPAAFVFDGRMAL